MFSLKWGLVELEGAMPWVGQLFAGFFLEDLDSIPGWST